LLTIAILRYLVGAFPVGVLMTSSAFREAASRSAGVVQVFFATSDPIGACVVQTTPGSPSLAFSLLVGVDEHAAQIKQIKVNAE
jgi:glycerol-3-phosphate acyltransferase PlsY